MFFVAKNQQTRRPLSSEQTTNAPPATSAAAPQWRQRLRRSPEGHPPRWNSAGCWPGRVSPNGRREAARPPRWPRRRCPPRHRTKKNFRTNRGGAGRFGANPWGSTRRRRQTRHRNGAASRGRRSPPNMADSRKAAPPSRGFALPWPPAPPISGWSGAPRPRAGLRSLGVARDGPRLVKSPPRLPGGLRTGEEVYAPSAPAVPRGTPTLAWSRARPPKQFAPKKFSPKNVSAASASGTATRARAAREVPGITGPPRRGARRGPGLIRAGP